MKWRNTPPTVLLSPREPKYDSTVPFSGSSGVSVAVHIYFKSPCKELDRTFCEKKGNKNILRRNKAGPAIP